MRKVTREDIKDIAEYEKIRPDFRRFIIELKKIRRVPVGDILSFVFENRDTVIYQIQEMMRAERMVDEEKIQQEIDVYNELIPAKGQLSATMFIEIDDLERLRETLPRLVDIEKAVYLRIGAEHDIHGEYEPGRSKADTTSTVHYLKFTLTPEQIAAFQDEANDAYLEVRHPRYRARAKLEGQTRQSLIEDLQD